MKKCLLILTVLLFSVHAFASQQYDYAEYNFSVEIPSGWTQRLPPPENVIAEFTSQDQIKAIAILALKPSSDEMDTAMQEMHDGANEAMALLGMQIESEQEITLGEFSFKFALGRSDFGMSTATYTTVAGDYAYMLQSLYQSGNAADDPDLKSIVESFRLISPVESEQSSNEVHPKADQPAGLFIKLLILFGIPILIFLIVRKAPKPKKYGSVDAKNHPTD